jgi:hypothetical protein
MEQIVRNNRRAFSFIELMISITISAAIGVAAIVAVKKLGTTNKVEVIKSSIIRNHDEAKTIMDRDLRQAYSISGSSSKFYYPVARTNPAAFNTLDAFDGITIYKNVYTDISGSVRVAPLVAADALQQTPAYFPVYYILENPSVPTSTDQYFQMAMKTKKYFFLTGSDLRNIIENIDMGNLPSQVDCPACTYGTCPPQKCYKFRGSYRDTAGNIVTDPTPILNYGEVVRPETILRVGEKVSYSVGGNCSANTLCRVVDDKAASARSVLGNVVQMRVRYEFSVSTGETKPSSTTFPDGLRSPLESTYWTSLGTTDTARALKAVKFTNVTGAKVTFQETLPSDLSKVISTQSTGEIPFEYNNGAYSYSSFIKFRPGKGVEAASGTVEAGVDVSECSSLDKARCNPSGKCNYLFNDSDPNSPTSTKYRYVPQPNAQGQLAPSDLCLCGWHPENGAFFDPREENNEYKFHYLNQTVYNIEEGDSYNDLSTGHGWSSAVIDKDRAMACARLTNCNEAGYWMQDHRNPICPILHYCIHPDALSRYWNSTTGFNESLFNSLISQNVLDPSQIQCDSGCDQMVNEYLDQNPTAAGAASPWKKSCACLTRYYQHYNADGTPQVNSATDISWDQLDWDSLCHVPNSFAAKNGITCNDTWNPVITGWTPRDAQHPQSLPKNLLELCACRRNINPNAAKTLDPDMRAVVATATINPNDQFGHNEIEPFDGTGTGPGGTWYWEYNWQERFSNPDFDFRINTMHSPNPTTYSAQPPPGNDPTLIVWTPGDNACGMDGWSGTANNPNWKCFSYKSQVARVRIQLLPQLGSSPPPISIYDINCGQSQAALGTSIGGCLETSHPAGTAPAGFPAAIGPTHNLWHYRWFCDDSCGQSSWNSGQFARYELDTIRWKIRQAVGETNDWVDWCPSLNSQPAGGGSSGGSLGG